jgi:cyclophilin family peptidyl-prolyl cis-trans isomerase/HEAT repeat protein
MRWRPFLPAAVFLACAIRVAAQPVARLSILQAEDRRAPTPRDLAILRAGLHSGEAGTVRAAVRALGRLERPALVADILPSLKHPLPEVRAEAANALGQAAAGWKQKPPAGGVDPIVRALEARLAVEDASDVRAAVCETLGRLPYTTPEQARRAGQALVDEIGRHTSLPDRLGVAEGLELLVRRQSALHPASPELITALLGLSTLRPTEATSAARIRRLALEALISAAAVDEDLIRRAATDPDAQVRRLAMRAAGLPAPEHPTDGAALAAGLTDDAAMVRLEAVRGLRNRLGDEACSPLVGALKDRDPQVDLVALDQLAMCGASTEAVAALERAAGDLSQALSPRGWHRAAHAIVALARAQPDRATPLMARVLGSGIWPLRLYAARAAAILGDRAALEKLAADDDDNVREAAIDGLVKTAGHTADPTYIAALARGYQVVRVAAAALAGTPAPEAAVPALKSALQRLVAEGHDNSHDARRAIAETLAALGVAAPAGAVPREPHAWDLDPDDLRRLASPRARVTIRGVGRFELALFTSEAPATVLRFAHLVETGYYNGLTFHRIVPNFVIQGGSPGANEYIGDASFMRDELGLWPHVRGAVGISTRGRDTGDGQIFIDLVDNPRLDHEYTVFAQVLNGIEVIDRLLEGDVIDTIEIIP